MVNDSFSNEQSRVSMRIATSPNYRASYRTIVQVAALAALVLKGSSFVSAFGLIACEEKLCTPDCICDFRDPVDCAKSYGDYGWKVPAHITLDDYVYHHMREPTPIEYYQIKPAGMHESGDDDDVQVAGEGIGFGKIMSIHNESLVGQVYFEVHPDQLKGSEKIFVELYGNVGFGLSDCAEHGTLLSRSIIGADEASSSSSTRSMGRQRVEDQRNTLNQTADVFSARIFPFQEYNNVYREFHVECHPRSIGAVMAAAEYTILDPFFLKSLVWFPDSANSTKGRLDYCIRVKVNPQAAARLGPPKASDAKAAAAASKFRAEDEEEENEPEPKKALLPYDTYIDTKIRIEGDRSVVDFASTSKDENNTEVESTHSSQAIEPTTEAEDALNINVFSYTCTDGGRGKYNDRGTVIPALDNSTGLTKRTYAVGQVFRVCVSPGPDFEEEYSVIAFESVVCENFGEGRRIFKEFEPTDTSIERENRTYIYNQDRSSMPYVNLETGEVFSASSTLSFRTRVTAGWRSLEETNVVCSGVVRLRHSSLLGRFENMTADKNYTEAEKELLALEEKQKTYRSDFSVTIDLLVIGNTVAAPIEEESGPEKWQIVLIVFGTTFWIVSLGLLCRWLYYNQLPRSLSFRLASSVASLLPHVKTKHRHQEHDYTYHESSSDSSIFHHRQNYDRHLIDGKRSHYDHGHHHHHHHRDHRHHGHHQRGYNDHRDDHNRNDRHHRDHDRHTSSKSKHKKHKKHKHRHKHSKDRVHSRSHHRKHESGTREETVPAESVSEESLPVESIPGESLPVEEYQELELP